MSGVVVSQEKIETIDVAFQFDADGSEFSAFIEPTQTYVRGKTLNECRNKARATIRRALTKLAIKAHIVNGEPDDWANLPYHRKPSFGRDAEREKRNVYPVIIRGISPRNMNEVLLEREDGLKTKTGGHSWDRNGELVRRLSKAEVDEYNRLFDARWKAHDAFETWINERKIKSPEKFVAEELEKAATAKFGAEEETGDPRVDAAPKQRRTTRRRT